MGSSEKTNQSTNQISDSALPDLSKFCISTLNEYMDGMSTDHQFATARDLCVDLFSKWSDTEQVYFIEQILDRMNVYQCAPIYAHLSLLLKRDFITMLSKNGMDHLNETILSYLDADELIAIELVSKDWMRIIGQSPLWKKLFEKKVQTDSLLLGLFKRHNWMQYLFKIPTGKTLPPYSFYRKLYPIIIKDIQLLEENWRQGKYTIQRIHCESERNRGVYCLQYDDTKIVSGLRDNSIRIWNFDSLQCDKILTGHHGSVLCLQYNDNVIISGSSDATIRVWDIHDGILLNTYVHHTEAVLHLRFENEMMVTCSKDQSIAVWHVSKTNEISLQRVLLGHRAAVNVVDFDKKYIVSASGDRTIKIWNTTDGDFVRTLKGHDRGIACLQYRDGLVVSGSSDKSIRIWNVESGKCIRILLGHQDLVRCLRFDTKRIVSGSYDGKIMVWDLVAALDPSLEPNTNVNFCLGTMKEHTGKLFRLQIDEFQIVSSSHDDTIIIWNYWNSSPPVTEPSPNSQLELQMDEQSEPQLEPIGPPDNQKPTS